MVPSRQMTRSRFSFSRREFLQLVALSGIGAAPALNLSRGILQAAPPTFEEIPPSVSGITWVHDNAMSADRYLPETMGPGVAFLDYDNDGWMDIFMVNSGPADFYKPQTPLSNALYKNNRDGTFTDVTEKAGVGGGTVRHGRARSATTTTTATPDILVTAYGPPHAVSQQRQRHVHRRHREVGPARPRRAGRPAPSGSTTTTTAGSICFSAASSEFSLKSNIFCGDNKLGKRFYCIPRVFKPTPSAALSTTTATARSPRSARGTDIEQALGKALGVVATDINDDGLMDLFVANDTVQNFLFANRGKGKWDEIGLAAEVGFSANGTPRSGMGVDAADFDGDGKQDLFVANVDQEMFSLYQNDGNEFFSDVAAANGVAQATRLLSGWGLKFFDYDNDGHVDLFLANGHPDDMIEQYAPAGEVQGAAAAVPQRRHEARERQRRPPARSSRRSFPARGLAVGDYNNDGRIDVLIGNNGDAPVLLKNNAGDGNHWVGLKLQGTSCNRDAVGARLTWSAGGVVAAEDEERRRQLPLVPRPARGARPRRPPRSSTGWRSRGRRQADATSASRTCPSIAT